jgi:hypothetical protein
MRLTTLMLALGAAGVAALPFTANAGRVEWGFIETPQPGGPPSAALSVNDLGDIFGTWESHDGGRASRVTGVMYPTWGVGQNIQNGFGNQNDLGHSVSGANLNYGGNSVDLRTLFGAEGMIYFANSLNNNGTIVGEMERGGIFRQAFRIVLHPDWQGGSGAWSDSAKWNYGGLGTAGFRLGREHDVLIAPSGSATIQGAANVAVRSLGINGTTGNTVTLSLNGGTTSTQLGTTLGANSVLTGNGRLDGGASVGLGGTIDVRASETMQLTGGKVSNAGAIRVIGSASQSARLNATAPIESVAGSRITAQNAVVNFTGGLTLAGQFNVIGNTQVSGPIKVTSGGLLQISGPGLALFRNQLDLQAGSELRADPRSFAAFLGRVYQRTGARITGTGMKFFLGGLSVGHSPGVGDIEGSVTFGENNFYEAEIGGLTACTTQCETDEALRHASHDKLNVDNELHFNGTLALVSWQGFEAQAGQTFDLFDATSFHGTFDRIDASDFKLAAGTKLDYSQLYTTGAINVTAVPEPGLPMLFGAGVAAMALIARRKRRTT